jgi:hypothetical protein
MTHELFVDGVLGIAYGKGAVRIDFCTLSPDAVDAKGQPVRERSQRIVMTTEVFMESVAMLQGVAEKLKAQGVAVRRALADAPAAEAGDDEPKAGGSPSPNF